VPHAAGPGVAAAASPPGGNFLLVGRSAWQLFGNSLAEQAGFPGPVENQKGPVTRSFAVALVEPPTSSASRVSR
jgi:hypothetical protein